MKRYIHSKESTMSKQLSDVGNARGLRVERSERSKTLSEHKQKSKRASAVEAFVRRRFDSATIPGLDVEVVRLVEALNCIPGVRTIESCCGHGERTFKIWLKVDRLTTLPRVAYWLDKCHCGISGWSLIARTDCAMQPVTFLIESTSVGAKAYEEANIIADKIISYEMSRNAA